jgi:alpha-beta hydrolase superfamily lysophospholipase
MGLRIVWSQDELHKRTAFERAIARCVPRLLRLAVVLGVALAALAIVGVVLAENALHPAVQPPGPKDDEQARGVARAHDAAFGDVRLVAPDGVVLGAWTFDPRGRTHGTVLALHGIGDSRRSELPLAGLLLDAGYRVVAPDWRRHGASGGAMATYGVVERVDLRAWSAWVRDRHPDECLFAVGASLGGSIALQAAPLEPFCAVVAEAPYATFRGTAAIRVSRQLGLPAATARVVALPLVEAGLLYARVRYGIALGSANPVEAIAASRVPVLVIEDGADDLVPPGDAARLAAANPGTVTVWTVPGARHVGAWGAAPEEYPARVLAFLAAHR